MLSLKSQRGHGHLLLFAALVVAGVAAVGYGVYQKSGSKELSSATTAASKTNHGEKTSQNGALVAFSEQGSYKYAKIKAINVDTNTHRCGKVFDKNGEVVVTLKAKGGSLFPCSPVKDEAIYWVYFGKTKTQFNSTYTVADVDAQTCTRVHADPTKTSKAAYFGGSVKVCTDAEDTPTPVADAVLAVENFNGSKPLVAGATKAIVYVSVKSPNTVFTKNQCVGQVDTIVSDGATVAYKTTRPIKQKLIINATQGHSYCVTKVTVPFKNLTAGKTYSIGAHFPGSPFVPQLNAQPVTFVAPAKKVAKSVTVPCTPSAGVHCDSSSSKKTTGGATAPSN